MAKIEAIFLPDDTNRVVESVNTQDVISIIQKEPQNPNKWHKIGEIYQEAQNDLKFVCCHCSDEFLLFSQFAVHVEQHLLQFYSATLQTKVIKVEEETQLGDVKSRVDDNIDDYDATHIDNNEWAMRIEDEHRNDGDIDWGETIQKPSIAIAVQVFKCPELECAFSSKRLTALNRHKLIHVETRSINELNAIDLFDQNTFSPSSYECFVCHKRFKAKRICINHIRNHQRSIDSSQIYQCDRCSANFHMLHLYHEHRRLEHGIRRNYQHANKQHDTQIKACHMCSKQFLDLSAYKKHIRLHKKEKNYRPFKCHICGFEFIERGNLNRHLARHTGSREFTCSYCNKSFAKEYASEHIRTHTGEKRHQCSQCGMQFISGGSLKRHMISHSGEKRYKCNLCPKSYARSDKLLAHRRGHTGDFIYNCKWCPKGFGEKRGLKKHCISVHGRPYDEKMNDAIMNGQEIKAEIN